MNKPSITFTDALTGLPFTTPLTQEFIASLPTQAQWDRIGEPPLKPEPPFVDDNGALPNGPNNSYMADYRAEASPVREPDTTYVIACDIGGLRQVIAEGEGDLLALPSLPITAGRSFYVVATNQYGETISHVVASANAHNYDHVLPPVI